MTHDKNIFTQLDTSNKYHVHVGNGAVLETQGKGTIAVQTKKGTKFINDVLLGPDLSENLLSIPQMMLHGYSVIFKDEHCIIYDPQKREIAKIKMQNKTFSLFWDTSLEQANKVQSDETWLWHKRYGYFNIGAFNFLYNKNMVRDIPFLPPIQNLCD
ncbi:uncharacterized protein LOC141648963 [Silene latifolia]|uniref:uncharacterized protein LOC141648963 n=1 Tax=Silene latifolia TaxID=37657 RepID=UPI003D7831F1